MKILFTHLCILVVSFLLMVSGIAQAMDKPRATSNDQFVQAMRNLDFKAMEEELEAGAEFDIGACNDPAVLFIFSDSIILRRPSASLEEESQILRFLSAPCLFNSFGECLLHHTPLTLAIREQRDRVIRFLLNHAVDVNARNECDSHNRSPLDLVLSNRNGERHRTLLRLFIMNGVEIFFHKDAIRKSLNNLEEAAVFGRTEAIEAIIASRLLQITPNTIIPLRPEDLDHAVALAAGQGQLEVVRLLLERGASPLIAVGPIGNILRRFTRLNDRVQSWRNTYERIQELLYENRIVPREMNLRLQLLEIPAPNQVGREIHSATPHL